MRIAIVDDDAAMRVVMNGHCLRYGEERGMHFDVECFSNGDDLLADYRRGRFAILFLDVEMPGTDGLEVARRVRRVDDAVTIVFVTNMAQCAIHGYEVAASDYIVKPLTYFDFELKFTKALRLAKGHAETVVTIDTVDGLRSFAIGEIHYVEVLDHYLLFHTQSGVYKARGSINEQSKTLQSHGFARIHKSYCVNLRHIKLLGATGLDCAGTTLPIGRTYKTSLMQEYLRFLGSVER